MPLVNGAVPRTWTVDRWRPDDATPNIDSAVLERRPNPSEPALLTDLPAYFDRVTGRPTT